MNEQQIIKQLKEIEEFLAQQLAEINQRQIRINLELQRMHNEIKGKGERYYERTTNNQTN